MPLVYRGALSRPSDHRWTLRKVATASGGKAQPGISGGPVRVLVSLAGEAIQDVPVAEPVALLDAGTGADHRLGPDHAAVEHDRAGFDDAAAADVAAVVFHTARIDRT